MKDASKQQSTETEEDMEEEEEELDEEYLDEGGEPGEDFGRSASAMHAVTTNRTHSVSISHFFIFASDKTTHA